MRETNARISLQWNKRMYYPPLSHITTQNIINYINYSNIFYLDIFAI